MNVSHKMAAMYPVIGNKSDPHKWIAEAMTHIKRGALTKTAAAHGKKPLAFAESVTAHPEHYSEKTRKRAQFLVNIQSKK